LPVAKLSESSENETFSFDYSNAEYLLDSAHIEGFEPLKYIFRKHPKSELLSLHLMRNKLAF
jgi:hypothetical protein